MEITFGDILTLALVILGIVELCYTIFTHKKITAELPNELPQIVRTAQKRP